NQDLFGQQDQAQICFTTAGKIEFSSLSSRKLHYFYPYGTNEWHHLAGVADGTNMFFYVDGVQVATRSDTPATYGSNTNPFNIGANVSSSGNYFVGSIDEVVVYDHPLGADQITSLYQGQIY